MRAKGRTTIYDVARAAGVSHQTVSNVLRGSGRVGAATRARVHAAIAELNYRPHAGAASLRTRRTGRIAYPIAAGDLGSMSMIMLEFVHALSCEAGRHGYHLVLVPGGREEDLDQLLRSSSVDAVVLANIAGHDERVAMLARRGVPFACFGRPDPALSRCWIDVDNCAGVRAVTSRLLHRGHERVAFLGYAPQGGWDAEREAGYRDAMAAAGLRARVSTPEPEQPLVVDAIDTLLQAPSPPTAIVTGSDVLASALYSAAAKRGIRIGTDLAVTGFDGSMVGRLLTPPLTTLAIPTARIAERLVARVLAELDGPTDDPGELVLPELVVGESG